MRSSARVEVIGHLGNDAELKFLDSGTAILSFSVAVNPYVRDGKERTNWYRCSLFGDRAEKLAAMLVKATPVFVRGDLDCRDWTGRDGKEGYSLDVRVTELELLGNKADREQIQGQQRGRTVTQSANDLDDADIPF